MEYMRGLLRDNDLFRAYVTVRKGRGAGQLGPPGQQVHWGRGAGGGRDLGPGGGARPEPRPRLRRSGPRSISSASG